MPIKCKECPDFTPHDVTSIHDAEQNKHVTMCVSIGCEKNCARQLTEEGLPFYDSDGSKLRYWKEVQRCLRSKD